MNREREKSREQVKRQIPNAGTIARTAFSDAASDIVTVVLSVEFINFGTMV